MLRLNFLPDDSQLVLLRYHDRGLDRIKSTICTQYCIKKAYQNASCKHIARSRSASRLAERHERRYTRWLSPRPPERSACSPARAHQLSRAAPTLSDCGHAIATGICMAHARSRSAAPSGNSAATGRFWVSKRLETTGAVSDVSGVTTSYRLPASMKHRIARRDKRDRKKRAGSWLTS